MRKAETVIRNSDKHLVGPVSPEETGLFYVQAPEQDEGPTMMMGGQTL